MRNDMVRDKAICTIEKERLIEDGEHIVIGLSGGPDSVCLFHVLNTLAEEKNLKLYPVHINHKFRPIAAEEDQDYAEKLSEMWGWKCHSFIYDCNRIAEDMKVTSEEAGRMVRYESFAKVADELVDAGIDRERIKIAVAQNADDQAETIMFRILRGAGIEGIAGINYSRSDQYGNTVIRPLLDVFKAEILNYCRDEGLEPRIDKTNHEPIYTRNKIRLNLLPEISREFNPNIKETLIRLGKAAFEDSSYIRSKAEEAMKDLVIREDKREVLLRGHALRELETPIRKRIISMSLEKLGLTSDVGFAHFESCDTLLFNEKPSAKINLPKGYFITKVYEDIKVGINDGSEKNRIVTHEHGIRVTIMSEAEYKGKTFEKNNFAAFDFDRLEEVYGSEAADKILLRERRSGDYFSIKNGRKKLQDCLVDMKIPRDEREITPMVAIGREILWIIPQNRAGRYNEKYKLCETTKRVISIELIGGI